MKEIIIQAQLAKYSPNFTYTDGNRVIFWDWLKYYKHIKAGDTPAEARTKTIAECRATFDSNIFDDSPIKPSKFFEFSTLTAKLQLSIDNLENAKSVRYCKIVIQGFTRYYFVTSVTIKRNTVAEYALRLDSFTTYFDKLNFRGEAYVKRTHRDRYIKNAKGDFILNLNPNSDVWNDDDSINVNDKIYKGSYDIDRTEFDKKAYGDLDNLNKSVWKFSVNNTTGTPDTAYIYALFTTNLNEYKPENDKWIHIETTDYEDLNRGPVIPYTILTVANGIGANNSALPDMPDLDPRHPRPGKGVIFQEYSNVIREQSPLLLGIYVSRIPLKSYAEIEEIGRFGQVYKGTDTDDDDRYQKEAFGIEPTQIGDSFRLSFDIGLPKINLANSVSWSEDLEPAIYKSEYFDLQLRHTTGSMKSLPLMYMKLDEIINIDCQAILEPSGVTEYYRVEFDTKFGESGANIFASKTYGQVPSLSNPYKDFMIRNMTQLQTGLTVAAINGGAAVGAVGAYTSGGFHSAIKNGLRKDPNVMFDDFDEDFAIGEAGAGLGGLLGPAGMLTGAAIGAGAGILSKSLQIHAQKQDLKRSPDTVIPGDGSLAQSILNSGYAFKTTAGISVVAHELAPYAKKIVARHFHKFGYVISRYMYFGNMDDFTTRENNTYWKINEFSNTIDKRGIPEEVISDLDTLFRHGMMIWTTSAINDINYFEVSNREKAIIEELA